MPLFLHPMLPDLHGVFACFLPFGKKTPGCTQLFEGELKKHNLICGAQNTECLFFIQQAFYLIIYFLHKRMKQITNTKIQATVTSLPVLCTTAQWFLLSLVLHY